MPFNDEGGHARESTVVVVSINSGQLNVAVVPSLEKAGLSGYDLLCMRIEVTKAERSDQLETPTLGVLFTNIVLCDNSANHETQHNT